jgi:hypothetical protein
MLEILEVGHERIALEWGWNGTERERESNYSIFCWTFEIFSPSENPSIHSIVSLRDLTRSCGGYCACLTKEPRRVRYCAVINVAEPLDWRCLSGKERRGEDVFYFWCWIWLS